MRGAKCSATFVLTEGNLKNHILIVYEYKIPFFRKKELHEGSKLQCDLCAKSFTTEGNLKNHIVIVHESKIPFQNSILDTSD